MHACRSTLEDPTAVLLALATGGVLGMAKLLGGLGRAVRLAPLASSDAPGRDALLVVCLVGFGLFATVLALRIWWTSLPILGGAA